MKRTHVRETSEKTGEEVRLLGWADTIRDHGKVVFIDLRDYTGKIQCVGTKELLPEVSTESVIEIVGNIKDRPSNLINPNIETGKIEVAVKSCTVLNKSAELPIPIDTDGYDIKEEVRLKYRYLDLRRGRMQKILRLRSRYFEAIRQRLIDQEFVEVETPMLTKSTKEGARDFVVPSRHHPGNFYALPQSPQQYKQLLMTAGIEKYFQTPRCIRDEDLRADRGYEHTQLDLEMSFVTQEEVMQTVEELVKGAVQEVGGKLKDETFPIFTYKEAMDKFGADKFDLRTDKEKEEGVLAFAWVIKFPFFKKVDKADKAEVEDGRSGWTFTHNPFSRPVDEHLEWLLKGEHVDEILTTQYDLVCNGYEAGGGSLRAYTPEVLTATYKIMGYSDQEIEAGVGHMLEAFKLGTPPHGGIALGLDRHVMVLAGEKSLKEVIAFPMSSSGKTSVMDAPSEISDEQLKELGLKVL